MDIQDKAGDSKGSFFIEEGGENIGKRLVEHTVNYAKENKLRMIPLCPFANSVIDRDDFLQDVLKRNFFY